jgi:hypothetical protein
MVQPRILDCESYASARKSLRDAFQISDGALIDFLTNLDVDEIYEACDAAEEPRRGALVDAVESHFKCEAGPIEKVAWFHLTRTLPTTTFAEGILPLGLVLERIWHILISIPGDKERSANLETLKKIGVPDHLYQLKTTSAFHYGPYAMLVRETAFQSKQMGNHDYLGFSEIIEDICNGYREQFGQTIHWQISDALKPCIVKFEVNNPSAPTLLEPAVRYCWCKANGESLDLGANTCFDGKGVLIPYQSIKYIEFPSGT